MNIDSIIPVNTFTEGEETILRVAFSDPTVVKYLKTMGQNDSKELLTLGVLDMPAESLARRHSLIAGKLSVIQTLLSISEVQTTNEEGR